MTNVVSRNDPALQKPISDAEFDKFREFFYKKTGIMFGDSKRYFVDKRLHERMYQTGADTFREYFVNVRFQASGAEMQELVNCMTVNETYFFREEHQFRCLTSNILDEIIANKTDKQPIRIWSMPSSTGEEAYSIAIYILEHWPGIDLHDIEIVASDIDSSVINAAKAGLYSARSVKNLPAQILGKHFKIHDKNHYRISDDLRNAIHFTQANLNDPYDMKKFNKIDVIFCRNLLIYFDDSSRRQAAETFYHALNPEGFILLGHSESMSRISGQFRVRKFNDAIVYQKAR